jgi:lysophospholipase L1-like esterase
MKNPLTNIVLKANKNLPFTVAFFGGSITWGGNCSDNENKSYRALASAWFKKEFSESKTKFINGGFGGTASYQGAYSLKEQILSHKPDLVFIEFSINDSNLAQSKIQGAYEAIIRNIWKANPETGVIILISGSIDDRQTEIITKKIAADFDIPVVDVGTHKRKLIQGGKYTNKDLWTDTVHPTDLGHKIYSELIIKLLKRLKKESPKTKTKFSAPKKTLYWTSEEYINARLLPAVKCATKGKGWAITEDHHKKFDGVYPEIKTWPPRNDWPFPYRKGLLCTKNIGDSISCTGKIKRLGLALDYLKGTTQIDIFVDGEYLETLEQYWEGERFPRVPECNILLDGKEHTIEAKLVKGSLNIGYFMLS